MRNTPFGTFISAALLLLPALALAQATRPSACHAVSAPMESTIEQVPVKVGDTVKKGDLIVQLRTADLEQRLAAAKALAEARAVAAQALRTDASRAAELTTAIAEQNQALAQATALQAAIANARVVSPADGIIVTLAAAQGGKVAQGQKLAEVGPADAQPEGDLEKQFAELLTGATLVGEFTITGGRGAATRPATQPAQRPARNERYQISSARKLFGDRWLITSRIQYGNKAETVPVPVPVIVRWAGDTPMIILTDTTIPGVGTYSARVLFHKDHYAGTWSGGAVGGHLFGKVQRAAPATQPATRPAQ
jgi:biotin carboxyl carrier protein